MFKDIADPVHGLIRLTKVEAELLATRAMQRLHNIHQLGLAYLVFPGANYTRHAHSIGACHNAGRMIDAIQRNADHELCKKYHEDFSKYRILALLHDIGHYPFSHATEHVIADYFTTTSGSTSLFASGKGVDQDQQPAPKAKQYRNHEEMGAFIIENDEEVVSVLKSNGYDPVEISERFRLTKPEYSPLSGIISSELDCDRLDYLRRTAMNSGAPYGSVDISFLIDQATLDNDGNFCFRGKAARSADHLLVSRFYDYMQVPFNKTAVALEWSLMESLKLVFGLGLIKPDAFAMEQRVSRGSDWQIFDDQYMFASFRKILSESTLSPVQADHLNAIACRRPAKLIASWDTLRSKSQSEGGADQYTEHAIKRKTLTKITGEFCEAHGLDRERMYVWECKVKFTKDGSDDDVESSDPSYFADGVHILDEKQGRARRLVKRGDMLVSTLSKAYLSGLRIYYMPERGDTKHVGTISQEFIAFAKDRFDLPTLP
jgi:uncharacterized protein